MSGPALEVERVSFAYARGRPVLREVTLTAAAGELLAILGTSGSGKTTLLKLCRGLLDPGSGVVRVLGESVRTGRGALDPRVAYIPQQLGLVRSLSVRDSILLGGLGRRGAWGLVRLGTAAAERRARELAARLGIEAKLDERAHALSGGERQRVAIARALLQGPHVLLADEFISQLDPHTAGQIVLLVREIAGSGVAVVLTTHEQALVRDPTDRAIVLRGGEKVVDVRTSAATHGEIAQATRR